jgi:hypothetical protein
MTVVENKEIIFTQSADGAAFGVARDDANYDKIALRTKDKRWLRVALSYLGCVRLLCSDQET